MGGALREERGAGEGGVVMNWKKRGVGVDWLILPFRVYVPWSGVFWFVLIFCLLVPRSTLRFLYFFLLCCVV